MARVIENFFLASLFTWITPIAILYGFNDNWIPGEIIVLYWSKHMKDFTLFKNKLKYKIVCYF